MKKLVLSTFSAFLLLFVLAGAVFAAPTAEKEHVRIKGTLHAVEVAVFGPNGSVISNATGSGKGSVLGNFTYSFTVAISPTSTGILYYHFVAANGDSLFSSGPGVGTDVGPNMGHVVETHTITGGTGRFAGASGNITIERLVTWTCECSGGIGTSYGTFTGDIVVVDR